MRTIIAGATFLVIGAGAASVGALDNVALEGSDTLEEVTKDVLAQCGAATAAGITYKGGGSTTGENAMTKATPTQFVAPMSRPLNPTTGVCAAGATAEGIVLGLDGISILSSAAQAANCGGGMAYTKNFAVTLDGTAAGAPVVDCAGCDAGTSNYKLGSFKDALALVYGGLTHSGAIDCAGPVRKSLVNKWGNLFESGCGLSDCAQLQHAFRRSDLSGTTDTLLALTGLASMPLAKTVSGATAKVEGFCNTFGMGAIFGGDGDYADKDPIRRTCTANEQVCAKDGTLGLVLPIDVPANMTNATLYPAQACTLGKFKLLLPNANGGTSVTTCPNGNGLLFSKCFQPYVADAAGNFVTANCIAGSTPVQGIGGAGLNGKAYNLYVKADDGSYVKDNLNRQVGAALARIHMTKVTTASPSPAGVGCKTASETEQIGCLAQASPCSIGYAGREAEFQPQPLPNPPTVAALLIKGLAPTQANIENLTVTPADASDDYPLSRKLFFNTLIGFEHVAGGELELAKCMANDTIVGPIIAARGFIKVPGGVLCQSFDETQTVAAGTPPGCGAATDSDSCGNNPPGFPPTHH